MLKSSNIAFISELIIFCLIITGLLPRAFSIYLAGVLAVYVLLANLEDAAILFVLSIPFFLALPITKNFDNFNTWRILSLLIFIKWIAKEFLIFNLQFSIKSQFSKLKNLKLKNYSLLLITLLVLACLSILVAPNKILAVKRVIYFVNLSLVGIVIYDLVKKNQDFAKRLIKAIAIPTIIVTVIGFIQLISTYVMDIYQFMGFWAGKVQFNQFGAGWSYITYNLGNTWFAYYGEQISLRMFSLFPDSHSFPLFLLLGLPSIFVIALIKLIRKNHENFKKMVHARGILAVVWIPIIFLAIILSETRGIWAAALGVLVVIMFIVLMLKKRELETKKNIFKYMSLHLIFFFMLFSVAYPIFASPQFKLYKLDSELLGKRIRSVISFGETSNKERIRIWTLSLKSIEKRPLLGVGIGNFPIVLGQDLSLAKAGSSAHNLYLHIAAEMGIPALIIAIWFLWILIKKIYGNFIKSKDWEIKIYNSAMLIFLPWVLIYSLTDPAIFDERAFLLFATVTVLILAIHE